MRWPDQHLANVDAFAAGMQMASFAVLGELLGGLAILGGLGCRGRRRQRSDQAFDGLVQKPLRDACAVSAVQQRLDVQR